jgi:hypothetical protein
MTLAGRDTTGKRNSAHSLSGYQLTGTAYQPAGSW